MDAGVYGACQVNVIPTDLHVIAGNLSVVRYRDEIL
jgi:hypothetical protein